jgi:putative SOS response-associated peptidase YedK
MLANTIDREAYITAKSFRIHYSPYPAERMAAYEVSTRVNSPAYNGPDLVKPS